MNSSVHDMTRWIAAQAGGRRAAGRRAAGERYPSRRCSRRSSASPSAQYTRGAAGPPQLHAYGLGWSCRTTRRKVGDAHGEHSWMSALLALVPRSGWGWWYLNLDPAELPHALYVPVFDAFLAPLRATGSRDAYPLRRARGPGPRAAERAWRPSARPAPARRWLDAYAGPSPTPKPDPSSPSGRRAAGWWPLSGRGHTGVMEHCTTTCSGCSGRTPSWGGLPRLHHQRGGRGQWLRFGGRTLNRTAEPAASAAP